MKPGSAPRDWTPDYMEPGEVEGMLHALRTPQREENYRRTLASLVFNARLLSEEQRAEVCRNILEPPTMRRGRRPKTERHKEIVRLLEPGVLRFPGGDWSKLPRLEAIHRIADRWGLDGDPTNGSARTAYDKAMREIRRSRGPQSGADGKPLAYFDMTGAFHPGG